VTLTYVGNEAKSGNGNFHMDSICTDYVPKSKCNWSVWLI